MRKFFNSLPFVLILMLATVALFGQLLPLEIKQVLLSISLLCKEIIIFLLPLIIFSFVLSGLTELQSESFKLVAILIPLVCISNFAGLWASYLISSPILNHSTLHISKLQPTNILEPNFIIHFPTVIKNDWALFGAISIAFLNNFIKSKKLIIYGKKASVIANFILKKIICPILPFFVLGFIIKMQYEQTLTLVIKEYSLILLLVACLAYGYMSIVLFVLSENNYKLTFNRFKNLFPSVLIGLFSMSSAAAIPTTIAASEKNLQNGKLASFVVPASANMHLLGDCFAIPIIACALMISFGYTYPTPIEYLIFTCKGVIAKFAAAAIPGGSALIFAPILIDTFGFSTEMITAFTTIYLLFDPVATSTNVFGHGIFAILFEQIFNLFKKKANNGV